MKNVIYAVLLLGSLCGSVVYADDTVAACKAKAAANEQARWGQCRAYWETCYQTYYAWKQGCDQMMHSCVDQANWQYGIDIQFCDLEAEEHDKQGKPDPDGPEDAPPVAVMQQSHPSVRF